jgi:hypothetical protein
MFLMLKLLCEVVFLVKFWEGVEESEKEDWISLRKMYLLYAHVCAYPPCFFSH